ncbi:MAG: CopG family transcriptional regulator [Methanobrevibacter sp.]|nr:CopG family transcriptional regulator [Methanobrevibacter sp.]
MSENKRINISLSEEQLTLIRKFKGIMGNTDSEIIRNITLAWLSEKSIISSTVKSKEGLL